MCETNNNQMEYTKLWVTLSTQLWSRLQSTAVLHSAVLLGWYKLKDTESGLKFGILLVGISISVLIITLMIRDSLYMKKIKDLAGETFPTVKGGGTGRVCGILIVVAFAVAEVKLIFS